MKPYSATFPGFLIRQRNYWNPPTNDTLYYSYSSGSRRVSCGPIVKGNFRSPNNWSFRVSTRINGPLQATYSSHVGTDTWSGCYVGTTEGLATWLSKDMDAAVAAAYSDLIEKVRGGMDISVDAFQARQTIGTPKQILQVINEMRRIGKHLRRSDIIRPMKMAGNAWLIWVYGVKPTMQTIYDATKFTRDHYLNQVTVFEGKATRATEKGIFVDNWPDSSGWSSYCKVKTSCRARYKIRMKIPDNSLTSAARLSSLNPASIAWELMPWSFVIDWFYNIGDYLRGVETSLVYGRYFSDGFLTKTFISESDQTATRSKSPPPGVLWSGSYRATARDIDLNRTVLSSFPSVPIPKLRPELGSGRLLNAAALLTTLLGRKSS